ncbi:MAG: helix-turn-helix domain-containing protein [Wolbachia pipientis]
MLMKRDTSQTEDKRSRSGRGYTQEELAKKLDVGPSQIHHYEQGNRYSFK